MIRKDTETKNLRKTILKYSKDIPVVGERHRGVFSITGYRVYNSPPSTGYVEVDVVFKGEIKAAVSALQPDKWFGADVKKNGSYHISPVRLGRFLRSGLVKDVNYHMAYFDTKIRDVYSIKTIKWI